jgi:hypothetical protein
LLEQTGSETEAKPNQPQPQPQSIGGVGSEPAPATPRKSIISEDAFALSTEILVLMGLNPHDPISVGSPYTVQNWFNGGWP